MATSKQARGSVKSLTEMSDLGFSIAGASSSLPVIEAETTLVSAPQAPDAQDDIPVELMSFLTGGFTVDAEDGFDKSVFAEELTKELTSRGVNAKIITHVVSQMEIDEEGFNAFKDMFPNEPVKAAQAAVNILAKHKPEIFPKAKTMTTQAPQQQQTPQSAPADGGGNVPPTKPRKFTSFSDRINPVVPTGVAVGKNSNVISLKEFDGKYQAYVDEKFDVAYSLATQASLAYIYEYCVHIKDVVAHQTGYQLKETELNGMFRESVVAHVYGLGDGLAVPLSVMKDVFQTMLQALMAMHAKKRHRATDVEESKSLIYRTDLELSDYFFAAVAVGAVALCGYVLYRVARSYFAGGKEQA